ncbi:LysR family transcriptional regulator [Fundicoccus culcitae]|uniref:LysR family transcriptional regulator n=1 Tax=Fundicoccus culcitae TaxID=2969821 RepID=A0ABY5P417_9LACT|nr:LysR family transcriptional regulator [Fundicoccus culcitae]UUX33489.1 LysR family transcriptional regulator [Fundicoccus culcitae]
MEINQLYYFVTIVNANYNISEAAKRIHISQPALSRAVAKLEAEQTHKLFVRRRGRLVGLTPSGDIVYAHAMSILVEHDTMLRELNDIAMYDLGNVKIGVPPIILSILMTRPLSRLMVINPDINIILSEKSSFEIQTDLRNRRLDFGLIMSPNEINTTYFNEDIIFDEELVLYVNDQHPLAKSRRPVRWDELNDYKLSILNDQFMIHHLLIAKFNQYRLKPKILHKVGSWDFLLETAKNSDIVTILPETIHRVGVMDNLVKVYVEDPVKWKIALISHKKNEYTQIEKYFRYSFFNYFSQGENIDALVPFTAEKN